MKVLSTSLLPLCLACTPRDPNKEIDEGTVKDNHYSSKEVGWTIDIPRGYTVTQRDVVEEMDQLGKEALEGVMDEEIDFTELKHLIHFKRDPFNNLQSTSQPFDEVYEGEWKESNQNLKKVIYETYTNQGISADTTATTLLTIDGLDFESFETRIYGPDGAVILHQIMISRLINGLDFGISLNYNNPKDKKLLLDAVTSSKFNRPTSN